MYQMLAPDALCELTVNVCAAIRMALVVNTHYSRERKPANEQFTA